MEEAVQQAAMAAQQNDSVLLSPACASFDMFKNYEHRGEVFTQIVNYLFMKGFKANHLTERNLINKAFKSCLTYTCFSKYNTIISNLS